MERRYKLTSGCGDCGARFTSGTTRRFGVAPAAARGQASECCGDEDTVFARIN
ncbi:hypothetical protein [Desulfosporosinus orientis]|uniref:hypothetical protein n=1 Tax=Desulfosporosinus orientis TaxID=1563 RepID=UPI00130530F3|nr:hypothetical protein [Desulfosporosinus orientis]